MRSERKRRRTFLARFMVLFMIINLLSGVNPSVVRADESPVKNYKNDSPVEGTADNEGISISKEVLAENSDGTFNVKLTVKGAEKITKKNKKTDIVLVVDTSGSMREPKAGNYYTDKRIRNAKEAATSFVNRMISESGEGDIRIGLVSFASEVEKKSDLTNNKNSLITAIQNLTADGGTYTQAALELANEMLRGGEAEEKIIVLISDGKPTFANGTHPNFGERGPNGYTRINDNSVKTGYEIWHGETSGFTGKWIGKGYDSSGKYGNYSVKLISGKFGDGTESHHGQGAKSWPYNLMGDYFRNATISAADKIKNDKVKIYSVGIGLKEDTADGNETKADKKLGRDVLEGIANNGNYLDAGAQAEELNKILESLAVEIHHNKVINGTIVDPMSNYVEYVDDSAKIGDNKNVKLEVPSNNNNNTLKISNINLGKDEKLEVVYKVRLKENWKDGEFHPANGETTLTPTPNAKPMNFKVPEVRAEKETVTLTVNKTWIGKAPVNSVTFNIKVGNTVLNDTVVVTEDSSGNWTGKLENLPKYEHGKDIQYTVEEVKGNNYELKGDINSKADKDGNITFTATNQNTEKVNITVTKKWVNTPDEYKDDIKVAIYSRAEGETDFKKGEIQTLSKSDENKKMTLFTNLPKYDKAEKLIEYKVEEEGTDKEGKLKIGDNSFKVDVEQSKNNNYDWTITNTCDHIEKHIRFTLVKKWDKKPDEKVKAKFNLIAKVNGEIISTIPIVLPEKLQGEDQSVNTKISSDGKTWTTVIEPYKYDSDNNLIEYSILEEKLNAYVSDPAGEVEVVDGKTITFYNTRIMRTLTLEKKWIGSKADKAEFTLSDNNGNEVITLSDANSWKGVKDLPVYSLDGKVIEYTITEKKIDGYKANPENKSFTLVNGKNEPANTTVTFTNTKMIEKPFTVHKTWVGEPASKVSFGLFDGTNIVDTLELTALNVQVPTQKQTVWEGTFKGEYPEYKLVGGKAEIIQYEVKEIDADKKPVNGEVKLGNRTFKVESTRARVTDNTYNFKNTDITKTDISVTKTWFGKVPMYQLVHFGLYKVKADGLELVDNENYKLENTRTSVWTVSFKDVPAVDENGNKIEYVIKEVFGDRPDAVNTGDTVTLGKTNYKVSYDENGNITNTEIIDLTVKKEWGKNVPEIAKQSVKFRITDDPRSDMNGKSFLLYEANGWTKSFENLPLYNAKGEKINYTVVETEINGDEVEPGPSAKKYYHSAFEITAEDAENITKSQTITIKNSIVNANNDDSDNRTINVVKGWSEGAERKPVTVKLYQLDTAKGEIVPVENGETELRADNHWQTKFEVPKKDKGGNEILYYAFETAVGNAKVDESKLSPNLYNEGYQIGEYEVSIAELTSDEEGAEIGNYGFYILNTANNKEVKPEEKVNINVTKKWLIPDNSEYVKPVRVRLFIKAGEYLVPVSDATDLTLDANNKWNGKFADLDKFNNDGDQIEYYVAEVGVGDYTKEIISLDQISGVNGYTIGRYNVTIDGNGTDNVVISNDVALIEVIAVKNWIGATPRQAVEFTLYSKQGENLVSTGKKVTLNGTDENTVATFTELPRLDNEGKPVVYYVYETKIGATPITLNPTAVETMDYSVDVSGGKYSVVVTDNGTNGDKKVIISNTFIPNPVIPVIPGGDTPVIPGGTPIIPPVAPTPNPSTPVVDVPNDPSPQGPATPVNDGDEDNGVTEIDEDDVPQGDGKEVKKDNKANKDTVDITDNKAPKGTANLPKTGGEAGNFLPIIGLGLIGLGLVIRRRR